MLKRLREWRGLDSWASRRLLHGRVEVGALRAGLRELGYSEGKNIIIEFRWATSVTEMYMLATELARMNVDIIFAPASTQVEPGRRRRSPIRSPLP